jgi:aryl-alcohol dehydrogenase-like predicted oxidoreductase
MRFRLLGRTGISVSEVGIGTWELAGDVWGAKQDDESARAILAGVDAGATLVDTAADYGEGHVEELLGSLFTSGRLRRDEIVLTTKVRPEGMQFAPPPEIPIDACFRPAWIRSECEASLRRLQTDRVDVLFLHTWSTAWAAEDAWYEEMVRLRDEGKIRAIGISVPDQGVAHANVAIAKEQVDVIQCVYSVFQQEPEHTLFPLARQHGVGILARSPFSSGALVQQWTPDTTFPEGDWRASWPQRTHPNWVADQARMAEVVGDVITRNGIAKPEFCLRYVLGDPTVSSVIPGSADPDHVRGNVMVSPAEPLDDAVRTELKELWVQRLIEGTYNGSD